MGEFLELEGVLLPLAGLGMKTTYTFIDTVRQLECICMGCIKAIMKYPFGMEYTITMVGEKVFYKLIEGSLVRLFTCIVSN